MSETLKEQVVAVTEEVERFDMYRHRSDSFSTSGPETGYVVVTLSGMAGDILGTEHVRVTDLWGKVVERATEVKPSSRVVIHLHVYKERGDIRTIIHTHARYSTVFSVVNKPIMPIVYECTYLGKTGTVPVAPYGRTGTVDLARKVVEVMKEYDRCLMGSRGAIAVDEDMNAASLKT